MKIPLETPMKWNNTPEIVKIIEKRIKFLKKQKSDPMLDSNRVFYGGGIYELQELLELMKK